MRRIFWGFCRNKFLIDLSHLPFEPFRFWLLIRGDIHNRKRTPRLGESGSRRLSDLASPGVDDSPIRRVGESAIECLKENFGELGSCYGESGSCYSNFLKIFIILNS
jgi:hypothetical protein